jgi:hypothetical protein
LKVLPQNKSEKSVILLTSIQLRLHSLPKFEINDFIIAFNSSISLTGYIPVKDVNILYSSFVNKSSSVFLSFIATLSKIDFITISDIFKFFFSLLTESKSNASTICFI